VWVTPITKNSASGPNAGGAYHGYSASDFYDVEPRFGSIQELKELVDAAHAMGLKFVIDQVANHSGNRIPWFTDWPTKTWVHYEDQTPWPRNNFDIAGLADPYSRPKRRDPPLDGWFNQAMPDLNQDDPLVADYLIQNGLWWMGISGVDAFRMDTFPYVDRPFWEKYHTAINRQYPAFVVTGEITAPNPVALSFFEGGEKRRGVDTKLRSILDFPLEVACCGQTRYEAQRHHPRGRADASDRLDLCGDCHIECGHDGHYGNPPRRPLICRVMNRPSAWR